MRLSSALATILALVGPNLTGAEQAPPKDLTDPTAERLDASVDFEIHDDCFYSLTIKFKHDTTLPIPPGAEVCNPAELIIAPDGLPWLAAREHYMLLPTKVRSNTLFDHLSIDFQPCGHPPFDVFTKPHYDFHVYTAPAEERELRNCDLLPGAPVCEFRTEQSTEAGRAFFNPLPSNVVGFEVGANTAVPFSGIHSWDFGSQPATAADWTEPVFVTGGYGNTLAFWEPMIPIEMVTGPEDRFFEDSLVFEGDVDPSTPTHYSVTYEAASGYTAVVISEGMASNCRPKGGKKGGTIEKDGKRKDGKAKGGGKAKRDVKQKGEKGKVSGGGKASKEKDDKGSKGGVSRRVLGVRGL